jgi:hypothetical protein
MDLDGDYILASDHDAAIAAKDAEIERLRAALADECDSHDYTEKLGNDKTSEIRRLLDLIYRLPDIWTDFNGYVPGDHAFQIVKEAGLKIDDEARAALALCERQQEGEK